MKRGQYIVVEGIDGSGKDLQAEVLMRSLQDEGYDPLKVAEPSDLPTGRLLREMLSSGKHRSCHPALFLADRLALQEETLVAALEAGRPLVSVRSFISTLAYQQLDWPLDWLVELHSLLPVKPDFVIYLDIDPTVGLERVGKRKTPTEMYEKVETLTRVRQNYMDLVDPQRYAGRLLKKLIAPEAVVLEVDSARPPSEVAAVIWDRLWPRLPH